MRITYTLLIAVSLLLSACGSSKKASKNRINLDEITVNAKDGDYRASAKRVWDITHTRVAISFNYEDKTANSRTWIDIKPYFYPSKKIELDAQSMIIDTVLVNGNYANYGYQENILTINLPKEYTRDEKLQLYIAYKAQPYLSKSKGSDAIRDDKGLYFINTDNSIAELPVQIWTQGETQANSHWVPTIDRPNERFTTQIEMTVPKQYKTLSNGELVEQIETSATHRTDIWKTEKEIQPYVMTMAIGDYVVVEDKEWNGKKINYYVEPEYAPYALEMFKNTPEMVDYFSKVTGVPYPWHKYSQVVVRDFVSGAMENTSATTFGEFINQTTKEIADHDHENVVMHELFHQWFGDYVTAESWSNITLNESFATYGEQLWRNYKYGKANAQVLGYEDLNTYLSASKNNDPPLARYHYKSREDVFDRISYQKGATILHYIHGLIGDEAFSESMRTYLTENALQPAEVANWRMAIEKVTGEDWNWFFDQWYNRGGHPKLAISYTFDDNKKVVAITFNQKQDEPVYRLPIMVDLASRDKRSSHKIDITKRVETITLPYPSNAKPIVLPDTKHWIVGEVMDEKTTEDWVRHFRLAEEDDFTTKVNALASNKERIGNSNITTLYKLALQDELYKIREYGLDFMLQQVGNGLKNNWKDTIIQVAEKDDSRHVRAKAFALLAKWNVRDIQPTINKGLADSSYKVNAEALMVLNNTNNDSAYIVAKEYFKNNYPKGDLLSAIWLVIGDKAKAEDTSLIAAYKYKMRGSRKIDFAEGLFEFITRTKEDVAFKNVTALHTDLAITENIASYRKGITTSLVGAAFFYKTEIREARAQQDVDKAKRRYAVLIEALEMIIDKESDEKNKKEYNKYLKQIKGI